MAWSGIDQEDASKTGKDATSSTNASRKSISVERPAVLLPLVTRLTRLTPPALSSGRRADYDAALSAIGFGRFHWWLLITIGWANAADAVELLCVSSLLPAAECDLHMTPEQKGYLSSSAFVGLMIGGYVWGGLGDAIGRKATLISALLFNALFGALSSVMQTYWPFLVCRFLSGVGVGGATPLVFSYFSEFSPKEYRGRMISFVSYFWIIGNVVVAAMAWIVIPRHIGYISSSFKYDSWRIFVLLSTMPSFLSGLALTRFPRSAQYLLSKGRNEEALEILRSVYRFNGGKVDDYPISRLEIVDCEESRNRSLLEVVVSVIRSTGQLFTTCLRPTLIMMGINFCIQFGYYGLWVWFPELFNRLEQYHEQYPGSSASVCSIIDAAVASNATDPCASAADVTAYQDEFIVAVAPMVLNVWTIVHMDRLGRKFFLVFGMCLSGVSVFLIYVVKESWQNLVLSCLFGSVSNLSFCAINCVSAELFPTHLRSTAIAVQMVVARVGAILGTSAFGQLLYINCAVPLLLVAGLLAGGGLLSLLLPNTTRVPLS
ncbi:synaptic vesicle glycoprotein 2C-like [Pollicipes pollicipes]|uniref:synaptic vesicle glycoprotein 2C-like n=1 Tax=Pollicipes pollicipes TaxID=41117 RepID=UPI0018855987|nr:synaptic vesicle glycoprotein 2C-like [Pollicipes pollicipes]